jgi:Cof subfamily protein (haloacid dehalogenase superfamily)
VARGISRLGGSSNRIRLLGIDVDGTLLDSRGQMPPRNLEAIRAAVRAGVHVSLVTGRSYPFARPVAMDLPVEVTLIVSNGAIERSIEGVTLARRLLDRGVARMVLGSTHEFRAAAAVIFDRDEERQIVYESMDWEHPGRKAYWIRNQSRLFQSLPLEAALVEDPIQVMFNGSVTAMRGLLSRLRLEAQDCALSLTEYEHRDFALIDVTAPEATKGRALAWRAEQLGLGRHEVMAVGDNWNDIEMLEFAGTPVVMENCVGGLKERGWHVTGHQDAAGLAQAIERFVLDDGGRR